VCVINTPGGEAVSQARLEQGVRFLLANWANNVLYQCNPDGTP